MKRIWIECPECKGSGEYDRIEHDSIPCAYCKGKGMVDLAEEDEDTQNQFYRDQYWEQR